MLVEILISFFVLLIIYIQWNGRYWRRMKVDDKAPRFIFGNLFDFILRRKHFGEVYRDIYRENPKAAYIGVYKLFNQPAVIVRDLELIKDILVKNFNQFINNDFTVNERLDPLLSKNPFLAKDDHWKMTRTHLAPLFTAARVKSYFPLINNVCERFKPYLEQFENVDFEAKRLCSNYTLEVVAAVTLSIEAETFKANKQSDFQKMSDMIFNPNVRDNIKTIMALFIPQISTIFQRRYVNIEIDQWMRFITDDARKIRGAAVQKRVDLFQNLLDLGNKCEMTQDRICGYSLTLLFEGYETSASLMAYSLMELARKPEAMKKAQEEVDHIMKKYNGIWCDEATQEMHYLDAVFLETLRLWPPIVAIKKILNSNYQLPPQYADSTHKPVIKAGTVVIIPAYAIHRDENYYPNPEEFEPERFLGEQKRSHNKYTYLAFGGDGPRYCLGMRFALAQSKSGIGTLLAKYNVKLAPKMQLPIRLSRTTFLLTTDEGLWLNLEKRQDIPIYPTE